MGVADGAAHFDAPHPVGIVGALRQHVGRYGAAERGPATTGVELVRRYEQRLPGSDVDIYAGPEFPVIFVNVGPLVLLVNLYTSFFHPDCYSITK